MKQHLVGCWFALSFVHALLLGGCDSRVEDDQTWPTSSAGTSAGGTTASGGGDSSGGSQTNGGTASASGGSPTGGSGGSAGGGTSGAGSGSGGVMTGPAPACSNAGAWQTSDLWESKTFDAYFIRNNYWNHDAAGAGSQTLWASTSRCWGVNSTHTDADPKGTVKGYPDIARGWVVGSAGFQNPNHGLAVQVSALTKAKIRWKMQAPTTGRTWALWDIYFHTSANPSDARAPVNLMIQQRIVDSDRWMQDDSSDWQKVTIAGYTFREFREGASVSSTRNRIMLYVDGENGDVLGTDDMLLDLKAVIDHYVGAGDILSTDYLTSIQAGWEIVSGGTYQTDDFWTAVQDEPEP